MADELALDPELQAFVEERLGPFTDTDVPNEPDESTEPDEVPEEVPDEGEPSAPVGPGTEEPPPEEPQSGIVEIAPGVAVTREQALSYYQLDALLRDNPDLFREVSEVLNRKSSGRGVTAGPPETPLPATLDIPADEFIDDRTRALYDAYNQQRAYIETMNQRLDALNDITVAQQREEIGALVLATKEQFAKEHNLTPAEATEVEQIAGRLNVLPSLMQGTDPLTGQPQQRSRTEALHRAFEIAYWQAPKYRERALADQVAERAKSTRRKQRLAGVSGGGGSVPKNMPAPKNEQERRAAMIREVAAAMGVSANEE
jgi:hypothetical protein